MASSSCLIDHNLSGLGFGTGFSFDKVPEVLVKVAEEYELPAVRGPLPHALHRHHRGRGLQDRERAVLAAAAQPGGAREAHQDRAGGEGARGHPFHAVGAGGLLGRALRLPRRGAVRGRLPPPAGRRDSSPASGADQRPPRRPPELRPQPGGRGLRRAGVPRGGQPPHRRLPGRGEGQRRFQRLRPHHPAPRGHGHGAGTGEEESRGRDREAAGRRLLRRAHRQRPVRGRDRPAPGLLRAGRQGAAPHRAGRHRRRPRRSTAARSARTPSRRTSRSACTGPWTSSWRGARRCSSRPRARTRSSSSCSPARATAARSSAWPPSCSAPSAALLPEITVSIGIGRPHRSLIDLRQSFYEASYAIKIRKLKGEPRRHRELRRPGLLRPAAGPAGHAVAGGLLRLRARQAAGVRRRRTPATS